MADDWKKIFTPEQLEFINDWFVPKPSAPTPLPYVLQPNLKSLKRSCIDDHNNSALSKSPQSEQSSRKCARSSGERGFVPGGSLTSSGVADKVGGEASSVIPFSSASAAKVRKVDGAQSHGRSYISMGGATDPAEDEIFMDYDFLYNHFASCLKMDDA